MLTDDEALSDERLAEIRAWAGQSPATLGQGYAKASVYAMWLLDEVERLREELRMLTATHSGEKDALYVGQSAATNPLRALMAEVERLRERLAASERESVALSKFAELLSVENARLRAQINGTVDD